MNQAIALESFPLSGTFMIWSRKGMVWNGFCVTFAPRTSGHRMVGSEGKARSRSWLA